MGSLALSQPNKPLPTLNPCLRPFWLTKARNRILYGGRSSSKSWDAAGFAIFLAQTCKLRILCTRQFQNKIEESVYTLLKIQIFRFGLQDKFRILDNKIICKTTGTEFIFYGLWRHIEEIKSLEGIDIHWAEEAHLLTETQWDILDPTIRKEGSQHWIIFNPRLATDFVYKKFVINTPANTIVRKINYDENPFLSSTIKAVIEEKRESDFESFQHIYLGEPLTDDEQSVIKRSWLLAALNAHNVLGFEGRGRKTLGFDIADAGKDACALVGAHGSLANWSDIWKAKEDELLKSCTRAWNEARARNSVIVYDAIGVGATAGAKFNELNYGKQATEQIQHAKFFAGGAVHKPDARYGDSGMKNKDYFSNIKAQVWWLTADRLKNTYNAVRNGHKFDDADMIFLDPTMPNLDKLIDELSTPKRDFDKANRVTVEGKRELAKREVDSPNLADAFVMAFSGELRKRMQISDEALAGA